MIHPNCVDNIVLASLIIRPVTRKDNDTLAVVLNRLSGPFNTAAAFVGLNRSSTIGAVGVATEGVVVRLRIRGVDLVDLFNISLDGTFEAALLLVLADRPLGRGVTAWTFAGAGVGASRGLRTAGNKLEGGSLGSPEESLVGKACIAFWAVAGLQGVASDFVLAVVVAEADQDGVVQSSMSAGRGEAVSSGFF